MAERTDSPGGGDDNTQDGSVPTGLTGVGIGAGEASTFEPEEDPEAAAERTGPEPEGGAA